MYIYPSDRVMPYVYRLTHKITGQFYTGYREANRLPSHLDLPKYKTSSTTIKRIGFDNFDYEIVAEFLDGESAYDFEQKSIRDNIDDPLCLNQHYVKEAGIRWKVSSDESRKKMSDQKKGVPLTEDQRRKMSEVRKGKIQTEETKKKRAEKFAKPWQIVFPDGSEKIVTNLAEFCRNHNLIPQAMRCIATGRQTIHRGFKCFFTQPSQDVCQSLHEMTA